MRAYLKTDAWIDRLSKMKHFKSVLFVTAFFEATISPLLPEVLILVVLAYRKDISWKVVAAVSALGSACGSLFMYCLGMFFYSSYGVPILRFIHGEAVAEKAKQLFEQNAFMAQFVASLTPLPDRVFSFLAGAFLVSLPVVFTATFLGRLLRAGVAAYLSYEYGDEARLYIKKHTKLTIIIIFILVCAYGVYKAL